jgi:two-component system, chemotaxis family, protein-glutamate methylesterase/glutaminase
MALRTLVVDDTVTYRKILSDVLREIPGIEVIGAVASGAIALKKIGPEKVQLVLLDVYMPDMDGVETLKRIKAEFPDVIVVMVSGISTRNADITIEALSLGAVDFVRKPDGPDAASNFTRLKTDLTSVLRYVNLHRLTSGVVGKAEKPAADRSAAPSRIVAPPRSFGACVIGVSTGGPEALTRMVPAFAGPLSVPILCVQHMPPVFTKSLAESLAKKSHIPVMEAQENQRVEPGAMYIAPGGHHMVVRFKDGGVVVGINDEPPENSCRPAVDVLFRSVAAAYGDRGVLAVVLTGMGSDGCSGVRALKRQGCYCITQSERSCVVYGMPRAVDEAGLSDKSIALEEIPREIEKLVGKRL